MKAQLVKNIKNKEQKGTPLIKCLTECEKDEIISVIKVNMERIVKKRLANLGLVPGVKLMKFKSAPLNGPLEVKLKGSSLILGRGIASQIFVECGKECNFR
jgi:Fe2+ transport system protein FeoA